jgi:hypothetical protein
MRAIAVLGELNAESEAATLVTLAQGTDPLPRQMALIALARMGQAKGEPPGGKAALGAMADAVFTGGEETSARARQTAASLQRAGSTALIILANKADGKRREVLPVPEANVDVDAMLESLVPRDFSDKDRAAAVLRYEAVLQRAALGALQTSGDRARAVLDALGSSEGSLEPFLGKDAAPGTEPARARAKEIARALEPSIIPLVRHPDPSMRTKAIVLLSRGTTDAAASAVAQGVDDPSEQVQRVALAAIGKQPNPKALAAVSKLLTSDDNWAIRVLAAQAAGRLGASGLGVDASKVLETAATKDSYALVREAALKALAGFDPVAGKTLAAKMAQSDPEPRVREAAKAIASK